MLAYLDVGLGIYAWLLLFGRTTHLQVLRELRRHSVLTVFVAVLIAATLWPVIVLGWMLGVHRD